MRMTQRLTALTLSLLMLLTMLPGAAAESAGQFSTSTEVISDIPRDFVFGSSATEPPADKPAETPDAKPDTAPDAKPTAAPAKKPGGMFGIADSKPTFNAGLAYLAGGTRLYESKNLRGDYLLSGGKGIVYAEKENSNHSAILIVLNDGTRLLEVWVKADAVTMFTQAEADAHALKDFGEELVRTHRGWQLPVTEVRGNEPAVTPVVTEAPQQTAAPVTQTPPSATQTPAATDQPAATQTPEAGDLNDDSDIFVEEIPEETVAPLPDPSFEPDEMPEVKKFVQYRTMDAPSNLSASHTRLGLMTLTWDGTEAAEAYQVLYKPVNGEEYTLLAQTTETSYSTSALDPSVVYYFRVQAVELDDDGNVINQSPQSGSFPYIVLGDAVIKDPRGKDTSTIRLEWHAVPGANLYDVMMSVHGKNDWSIVRTDLTGTLCDIRDISFDETYDFRVIPKRKLYNETVITGNSSRVAMVGSPMETPSFTQYDWTSTGLQLTWDAIPGASGYVIYRRAFHDDVTAYKKLVVLDEPVTSYVDTTMTPGVVYYYFVYSFKTCQPEGWRCFSLKGEIGMGIWLEAPQGISGLSLTNGTMLSWNAVTGATHYDVHISSVSGAAPVSNGRVSKPQGSHKNSTIGKQYYYHVRAVRLFSNGDVSCGPWSEEYSFTRQLVDPTYRALLIGNTYPNESNYLPGCDNDVNAMAAMLRRMTGTPYSINKQINLSDSGMISAIRSTFADATANDVSLFYYSGHGANAAETPDYHGSLVGTYHTYLSISRLKEELDKIPGRKIVILDSCHSGNMIGKSTGGEPGTGDLNAFNSMVVNAFAADGNMIDKAVEAEPVAEGEEIFVEWVDTIARGENDLANSGYYVITAAHSSERSVSTAYDQNGDGEADMYFGLFTYGLCYGSGWNIPTGSVTPLYADADKNNEISLYEAYRYAKAAAQSHNPYQTAQIYPANSALVIWAK
ncbi:MAG: caspase family protein [Clostridia bacterium]|nr:caspase family protein [Clostridia bacterium]